MIVYTPSIERLISFIITMYKARNRRRKRVGGDVTFEKTLARCGYCGYVWILRVESAVPKMCPRDKKRFANADGAPEWATKNVEIWKESFKTYESLRTRLSKLNGDASRERAARSGHSKRTRKC